MARFFVLSMVLLSVVSFVAAQDGTPAPAGATVPISTGCPESPNGTPTNSCFNLAGDTHVCCINPDSCGNRDANGGATCANGNYIIFSPPPPTFTEIDRSVVCPSCNGVPSNPCFALAGTSQVCCINSDSCESTTPTCDNNNYVLFTGTPTNPTPVNC